jgi:outer membrane protein assembly factor BamB
VAPFFFSASRKIQGKDAFAKEKRPMKNCLLCLALWISCSPLLAQEWTRFRGPNGSGHGVGVDVPLQWSEKDFAWKIELPGKGNSSPVLWGDKIFVTSGESKTGKRLVLCVNASDGKVLWKRDFAAGSYKMHQRNTVATSTPTVDEDRLYLTWATPENYTVQALDHQGKELWEISLGPYKSQHGFGSSPIVFEDLLILPNEQDGGGSLVALDKKTGKQAWSIPRQSGNATYATPCIYQPKGKPAEIIFTNWKHGITAVNPHTGKVTWEISCFEPTKNERSIASPVLANDLILGTCGFVTAQKHFVAVRPLQGNKVQEVWRFEKAVSYLPTPLVKGDHIYLCSEKGVISCLEVSSGKIVWQDRLEGQFSASPVCLEDRIYCVANTGEVSVLAANPTKFQVLNQAFLGENTQSTPAIGAGRILFRTESQLMALGALKK